MHITVQNVQNANIFISKVGINFLNIYLNPVIFAGNKYHMDYISEMFWCNVNG